ncbi:MFS transporter [Leucobacter rhizosphaerae]|uniref:MFS transporter n=1 Tax=Leucobacter rhizosphaerae TaxID=2932245 RepID=A0ABY4FSI9_9MICO|nr:MFS transporter [Leucobacter rhizosphaerae]UOQ59144.1 MFS transporter [Leucobacter rhizosphaerae]
MSTLPPPSVEPRQPLTLRTGSATFLIALASLMMANLAPFVMTALAALGFDVLTSGNILTGALLASAAVGLGTARLAAGTLRRRLALAGLALATVAFGAAALAPAPAIAVTGLIVGGAGIGAAISTSGAAIAALRNPNRISAASGLVNRVLITLVLAVIPLIGITQGSVFGTLALISLVGLALASWLPDPPAHAEPVDVTTSLRIAAPRRITLAGIAILVVFPLWGTSEDAIWTMAPVLGGALGMGEQTLGFTLSLSAAGGILGMLVVAVFGHRIGRALPLAIAIVAGGVLKVCLGFTEDPTVLAVLIIAVSTFYAFAFSLFIATAAGLDARGRWSGPLLGAYLVGSSFAPLIGGALIEWWGIPAFTWVMGLVSALVLIPTILIARVSTAAERALARSTGSAASATVTPERTSPSPDALAR